MSIPSKLMWMFLFRKSFIYVKPMCQDSDIINENHPTDIFYYTIEMFTLY